ncbi:unnamed protein product [Polarella glacialis]|uniref:Peptide deformylase n=2 Tax=Polarella glacialis TaxID=89957 RepID=A0A813LNJ3_POLGL|nr:unnamed protein product [Polarella glacialis]
MATAGGCLAVLKAGRARLVVQQPYLDRGGLMLRRAKALPASLAFDDEGEATDGSWTLPSEVYSDLLRSIPGSTLQDRKVIPLGKSELRKKSKLVKGENILERRSRDVAGELLRLMQGSKLPGVFKGGFLTAPQIGTPSRLVIFEDPAGAVDQLSSEERAREGREQPFGPKAIFNPRLKPVSAAMTVAWEKDVSIPGYRALVERPLSVQVNGVDPEGKRVNYVATGWEARIVQQAVDVLDGVMFIDRCYMRSLRHLDARNDPLPPDCPPVGVVTEFGDLQSAELTAEQLAAVADSGGSRGFLAGIPGFGRPNVLLAGSLLLRLRAEEITDPGSSEVTGLIKEMRDMVSSGKHPLGVAGPQIGKRLRVVALGENSESLEKLSARTKVTEERRAFGPLVVLNPVLSRHKGSSDAYFFERSATVPGYEGIVRRTAEVDVEGLDEKGQPISFVARGWQANGLVAFCLGSFVLAW